VRCMEEGAIAGGHVLVGRPLKVRCNLTYETTMTTKRKRKRKRRTPASNCLNCMHYHVALGACYCFAMICYAKQQSIPTKVDYDQPYTDVCTLE
jgi:hypothetical protein